MENRPRFASRTSWNLELNRLAQALEARRKSGREILDLTESNPTRCVFQYNGGSLLQPLADARALLYEPHPRGLLPAREAVVRYYAERRVMVRPEQIVLTSGSSEAYSYLFRLLAEPGDNVLVPRPGYPLFEFLSRLNDVELSSYRLAYHGSWDIDFDSLEAAADERTRAVIVVNPNNPTGSIIRPSERQTIEDFCRRRGLALISDEVFLDYTFPEAAAAAGSFAGTRDCLAFALNGLSKTAALPQMKLGWIAAAGPAGPVGEALERLEVIADTYLSVATPVQWALPELLAAGRRIQIQIFNRLAGNLHCLDQLLSGQSLCSRWNIDAGWSAILRVPGTLSDEERALELLDKDGVLVHPGHFFDFGGEGYLVVSLLPPPAVFREGISRMLARITA